jgi:hypothetical protein
MFSEDAGESDDLGACYTTSTTKKSGFRYQLMQPLFTSSPASHFAFATNLMCGRAAVREPPGENVNRHELK